MTSEDTNKRITVIMASMTIIFVLLVLYLTYFQIIKADTIADNEYNKRLWVDENKVRRGTIYDRDMVPVVKTDRDSNGNNYRVFEYGPEYAHITGYNSKMYGTSGLEKTKSKELLNISKDTALSDLKNLVNATDQGNDIVLTVNTELQKKAYALLEGKQGAIVLMNPHSGEIYAMASRPSFDPNQISADWETLISDKENSPLINRATQGMYTPGSVFKLVTASAILEYPDKVEQEVQDNTGKVTFNNYTIRNARGSIYGATDLEKALVHSSNVYFSVNGVKLGQEILEEISKRYLVGEKIPFDIATGKGVNGFTKTKSDADIATTSFGQGETLISPLNMAMIMSTVANDGVMMQPYLVDRIVSKDGDVLSEMKGKELRKILSKDHAEQLMTYLAATARENDDLGYYQTSVAGKSGTAEIKDKTSTHAWYTAAAPAENARFVVVVILENNGGYGGREAGPLAGEMLNSAVQIIGLNE